MTTPPSSPNTIELSLGCRAAQFIGLLFLCYFTIFLALKSKILSPPSSHAVYMALSPLLKQPTEVTLPLKLVSNERMGLSGLAISMILTQLFMPTTILSLA